VLGNPEERPGRLNRPGLPRASNIPKHPERNEAQIKSLNDLDLNVFSE
jgi:hypothetical protein